MDRIVQTPRDHISDKVPPYLFDGFAPPEERKTGLSFIKGSVMKDEKIRQYDGVQYLGLRWIVAWVKCGTAKITRGELVKTVDVQLLKKVVDHEELRREFSDGYPEE